MSAEIPNPDEDPILYNIIKNNMIYRLCGNVSPKCCCMNNGKCSKSYPK